MSESTEILAQKTILLERQVANTETKNTIYGDTVELLKNEHDIYLEIALSRKM
ncbi:hypothetical protein [Enterovibrio coralii]|uniref:hypothetical protein n=1 Tax=Enterovibrio coralii TaxID=294935 RepID=UPI000AD74D2D|nr:hypothetical protein [Enterovibrio coralii]